MSDENKDSPKLADLDARLRAARGSQERSPNKRSAAGGAANPSGIGLAMRVGVEMVTTILVGTAIGYGLDNWLGTKPWLMIVWMLLGGAAGISNVYRVVKGLDDAVGLGRAIEEKERQDRERGSKIDNDPS